MSIKREQSLRKKNAELRKQNEWLREQIVALLADLEFTESMGCAFAMELALAPEDKSTVGASVLKGYMARVWAEAVK